MPENINVHLSTLISTGCWWSYTLNVAYIGPVANKWSEQGMEYARVGPAFLKNTQVGKSSADIQLYYVHAALLVLIGFVIDMIGAVQSGLSALQAYVVQLLGDI